jgi:phosphoadenosine phosphosulfate reductase
MSAALKAKTEELGRILVRAALEHAPAAFASSLGAEDMVITDAILRGGLDIEIFTLDTGRLHADTIGLVGAIREHYGRDMRGREIRVVRPDPDAVAQYVVVHGRNAFYESVELRKRCCEIRKVEPLRRALAGKGCWITGQRRDQSSTRSGLALQEHDAQHGLPKFNPLVDWSEADVWQYMARHGVPYNPLHEQGYRSIGCAPCTRPTLPGEDVRAGRWWWEAPEARECGLHLAPDGRLVRARKSEETPA